MTCPVVCVCACVDFSRSALYQNAWSVAAGLGDVGSDPGGKLFARLVAAWQATRIVGTLHLMCDDNGEERYHTLYMKVRVYILLL